MASRTGPGAAVRGRPAGFGATLAVVLAVVLASVLWGLAGAAQAAGKDVVVHADAAPVAGAFDAWVDTVGVAPAYGIAAVTLAIDCRAADGGLRRHSVSFWDLPLDNGQVYYRRLALPGDCVTWERLAGASAPLLGAGKADGDAADVTLRDGRRTDQDRVLPTPPLPTPPLQAPVQVIPVDGMEFHAAPPRLTTLQWEPLPGAGSYVVEVRLWDGAAWVPWSTFAPVYAHYVQFDLPRPGYGAWRVVALDAAGAYGRWSPWWQFHWPG